MSTARNGGSTQSELGPELVLFFVTALVFLRVAAFRFTNCDDGAYVYENAHVRGGLTWAGLVWAWTSLHGGVSYWHPLTWLSHQLDCAAFGLRAGPHHLTNVWFHALNSVLVFRFARQLGIGEQRAFLVGGLFALHPLHVESVAWISERKDVLYGAFWLLALRFFVRWRVERRRSLYAIALLLFVAALACKPTAMTLPPVLLATEILLDRQMGRRERLLVRLRLLWPFAVLSVASLGITFLGQWQLGAVQSLGPNPLSMRLGGAIVSYLIYVREFLLPWDLGFGKVVSGAHPSSTVLAAFLLLAGITIWFACRASSQPILLFGWAWFLVTLVPNIGLVQVGAQVRADRYMYIPLVGLGMMLATCLSPERPGIVLWRCAGLHAILLVCAALSFRQLAWWKDGVSLFSRAVSLNPNNWFAQQGLAGALMQAGDYEAAIPHLQRSLCLPGNRVEAHRKLGQCYFRMGNLKGALAEDELLRLESGSGETRRNQVGAAFLRLSETHGAATAPTNPDN